MHLKAIEYYAQRGGCLSPPFFPNQRYPAYPAGVGARGCEGLGAVRVHGCQDRSGLASRAGSHRHLIRGELSILPAFHPDKTHRPNAKYASSHVGSQQLRMTCGITTDLILPFGLLPPTYLAHRASTHASCLRVWSQVSRSTSETCSRYDEQRLTQTR